MSSSRSRGSRGSGRESRGSRRAGGSVGGACGTSAGAAGAEGAGAGLPPLDVADFECSICLGLLTDPCVGACGHDYCQVCLWRWTCEQGKSSCPICRAPLPTGGAPPRICRRLQRTVETLFPERLKERRQEVAAETARMQAAMLQREAGRQAPQGASPESSQEARRREPAAPEEGPEPRRQRMDTGLGRLAALHLHAAVQLMHARVAEQAPAPVAVALPPQGQQQGQPQQQLWTALVALPPPVGMPQWRGGPPLSSFTLGRVDADGGRAAGAGRRRRPRARRSMPPATAVSLRAAPL